MLKVILQTIGFICLAVALIAGVLDVTRSIANSTLVLTPLYDDWSRLSPDSLDWMRTTLEQSVHAYAWDPVFLTILKAPTWAIFAILALLCGLAARRRRRRWQENFTA